MAKAQISEKTTKSMKHKSGSNAGTMFRGNQKMEMTNTPATKKNKGNAKGPSSMKV